MREIRVENMNATANEEDVLEVGNTNFELEVLGSHKPVLVLFWAPRSEASRALQPALKEFISESATTIKFARINCDENPELTLWYGVHFIPTLLYFHRTIYARFEGTASHEAILSKLESCIQDFHSATLSKPSNEN
jgi:thioredoxin-like negative regulator of GroEL